MKIYQVLLSILLLPLSAAVFGQEETRDVMMSSDGGFGDGDGVAMQDEHTNYFVFNENAKVGVRRASDNQIVLQANFHHISIDRETELMLVYNDQAKVGLFDPKKNTFYLPITYMHISLGERIFGYEKGFKYRQMITLRKDTKEYELAILQDDSIVTHIPGLSAIRSTPVTDLSILTKNSKQGLFSMQSDSLLLPIIYDTVSSFSNKSYKIPSGNRLFLIRRENKTGIYSSTHKLLVPEVHDSVSVAGNALVGWSAKTVSIYPNDKPVWTHAKPQEIQSNASVIGFKNKKGKWELLRTIDQQPLLEKMLFDSLRIISGEASFFDFEERETSAPIFAYKGKDLYLVQASDSLHFVVIKDARIFNLFMGKFIFLESQGKRGIYSYELEEVVPFRFNQVMPWIGTNRKEKYWACKLDHSWYFYEGKDVYDSIQADSVRLFDINAYCAIKDGKIALVNRSKNIVTEFKYDFVELKTQAGDKLARIDSTYYYVSATGGSYPADIPYSKSGYQTLEAVTEAFMNALESSNDSLLYEFADKLTPDCNSYEYMNGWLADYRSFFKDFSYWKRKDALDRYYNKLLQIKQKLIRYSAGKRLQNKGFEDPTMRKAEITKRLTLTGTESSLIIQAGDDPESSYRVKLGELFLIDGYFKTFTMPKL